MENSEEKVKVLYGVYRLVNNIKVKDPSGKVCNISIEDEAGYIPVYETREKAEKEYSSNEIFEIILHNKTKDISKYIIMTEPPEINKSSKQKELYEEYCKEYPLIMGFREIDYEGWLEKEVLYLREYLETKNNTEKEGNK